MKVYNKLVRDKIPEIILKDNELPSTRILSDEEYIKELNRKLQEEVNEYLEAENIEETENEKRRKGKKVSSDDTNKGGKS